MAAWGPTKLEMDVKEVNMSSPWTVKDMKTNIMNGYVQYIQSDHTRNKTKEPGGVIIFTVNYLSTALIHTHCFTLKRMDLPVICMFSTGRKPSVNQPHFIPTSLKADL